jgi:hypothetical protein
MIVFLADVGVKENRRSLLCKTSGGDGEICEIEEPFSRAGLYVGEDKAAATRFEKEDGEIKSRIQATSKITGLKTGHYIPKQKEESSAPGYGALAAGTPRSTMLSPFLREGTALTWRTMAETGARGSAMSLPV